MIRFPEDRVYSKDHVWVWIDEEDSVLIGVSEAFLSMVGSPEEIEFVASEGQSFKRLEDLVRIASDEEEMELVAPFPGVVVEINEELLDSPESLEDDCYEDGWLLQVEVEPQWIDRLMSASDYEDYVLDEVEGAEEDEDDDLLDDEELDLEGDDLDDDMDEDEDEDEDEEELY